MKQKDIFEDQLKALFSDFEVPAPEDGWARLEEALEGTARVKLIRRNWFIGTAAAIAAVVVAGILFLNSPNQIHTNDQIITESKDSNELSEIYEKNILNSETRDITHSATETTGEKPATNRKAERKKNAPQTSKIKDIDITHNEPLFVSKSVTEIERDFTVIPGSEDEKSKSERVLDETQLSQEEIDRLILEFANAGNINVFGEEETTNDNAPIHLAVGGKGGLLSSQTIANKPMTLRSAAAVAPNDNNDEEFHGSFAKTPIFKAENPTLMTQNIADNIAEMDHAQPISFGITVSKSIFDTRFSAETGLIYTYLHSNAKNSSHNYSSREIQDFHYLGIPLNLNYNFVSIGNLDLFSSIGGMIEKDIHGEYRIYGQSDSKNLEVTSEGAMVQKIKQKNFQYSVNAGFGASYPIYGNLHLYAKFGGSYYFDAKNHQYKTIYSDRKIMLDLNAGIRFDF